MANMMDTRDYWFNTRIALDKLKKLLQCDLCGEPLSSPMSLPNCDHIFCLSCMKSHERSSSGTKCVLCPVVGCGDGGGRRRSGGVGKENRQVKTVLELCDKISAMISDGQEEADDIEVESEVDLVSNPGATTMRRRLSERRRSSEEKKAVVFPPTPVKPDKIDDEEREATAPSNKMGTKNIQRNSPRIARGRGVGKGRGIGRGRGVAKGRVVANSRGAAKAEILPNSDLNSSVTSDTSVAGKASPMTRSGKIKRNAKGETALHTAAIKDDPKSIREILEMGMPPNCKDNAGWTALHEACNHGNLECVRVLLDHNADVNVKGMDGDTPLHDAISNRHTQIVEELVRRGADVVARNELGITPLYLSKSSSMYDVVKTGLPDDYDPVSQNKIDAASSLSSSPELFLLGSGLRAHHRTLLHNLASSLPSIITIATSFSDPVTHVIMPCDSKGQCSRTLKYLCGVVSGKWCVSTEWLENCLLYSSRIDEEAFEVPGSTAHPDCFAARRSRIDKEKMVPPLFTNCTFYLHGTFPDPTREEVMLLLRLGEARILDSPPASLNTSDRVSVPKHSPAVTGKPCLFWLCHSSTTGRSTTSIPAAAKNNASIIVVDIEWLFNCIDTFKLSY